MKTIFALLVSLFVVIHHLPADPVLVAHRGASHDAPENTLPAFHLAWEQGADAIEGDFHLTSDQKIICIHDKDTARVTGKKLIVARSTLAELRALDAGSWFDPRFAGTRLPTFAEVAATVPPGKRFFIEIKCGPEIVPVLLPELKASGLANEQIVVISFQAPVIAELKKQSPATKAYWLSSFGKDPPLSPSADKVIATCKANRADGFSSKADPRVDGTFVAAIRAAGLEYHCWTVDDPTVARRFLELGAATITTNRPAFLRQAMASP
jgi:glycerophosphoryl diester phosphodiesterase